MRLEHVLDRMSQTMKLASYGPPVMARSVADRHLVSLRDERGEKPENLDFSIGFRRHLAGRGDYDRSVPRSRGSLISTWRRTVAVWLPSIIDQLWWECEGEGRDSRECS